MPRRHDSYVEDILESIDRIETYVKDMEFEDFSSDQKTIDAVVNNLENIGEAVKNLPESFKQEKQELNWDEIAGFRDILVHQYFRADEEIVWDIVENELPDLKEKLDG